MEEKGVCFGKVIEEVKLISEGLQEGVRKTFVTQILGWGDPRRKDKRFILAV